MNMLKKGYLLMEVSVAIAVVSIALAVILRSFTVALKSADLGLEYTKAALLLEDIFWELEETELRQGYLPDDIPLTGDIGKYKWSLRREKTEDTDLENISLNLSWKMRRRKESISASDYFREEEEEEAAE
jgi:hypothetical protein